MPRNGTFIAAPLIAALALLAPAELQHDGASIDRYKLGDIPLHILPLDEAADILSRHRYQSCSDTQKPVWDLQSLMWERGKRENVDYLFREALRVGMLIHKAFNTDTHLRLARIMMADEEKADAWFRIRKRQKECEAGIRGRRGRSPGIGEMLEADIREMERAGIDMWMVGCHERAADYFFMVEENEKAFHYLNRAYELSLSAGYHTNTAHIAGRVGTYHERTGNYDAAERAYADCLEFARLTGDHFAIARALSFMASLEKRRGRYVEAENLYLQSIGHCRLVEDPACEVSKLYNLAELHYSFGYLERAAYLTERAVLSAEQALDEIVIEKSPLKKRSLEFYLSSSLSLLARLRQKRGETGDALLAIERALDIAELSADKYYYSGLEKTAGDIYLSKGDFQQASRRYGRALKIIRSLGNRRREAEYLTSIADLRIRQGGFREAEEILRKAEATARTEGLWRVLLETEFLRGESAGRRDDPDEAAVHYERAVAVFDYTCPHISYEENKHDLAERMGALYSRILSLHGARFDAGDSLLFWAEKSIQRPCGGVSVSPRRLDEMIRECIAEREWIPADAFVIRYVAAEESLIGIGLDAGGEIFVHHAAAVRIDELAGEIRRFFVLCDPDRPVPGPGRAGPGDTSARLYRLLVEPFSASLAGKKIVCIIASDPLDRLPFAALQTPRGDLFCERIRIITAPSLLHLRRASISRTPSEQRARFSSPLLAGPPEMPPRMRRLFPDLPDMPYAVQEMDRIELLLGGGIRLAGANATPESLLEHMEHADLIHIAAHTVQFPVYSGEKAFILSPPGNESPPRIESSLLFERTIRELDLGSTRLVVLSACESAPGAVGGVGTVPGLAGAFYTAGAGSVIATIWPIEDRGASIMTTALYREILDGGVHPAEALAGIQRRMIAEDRTSGNPLNRIHIWAPYIVLSSLGPAW